MDDNDEKLLEIIQHAFPVTTRPYEELARSCGLTAAEVEARLEALREAGIIKRLGALVSSGDLGMTSTLAGARVQEAHLDRVAAAVAEYPEVTHSYSRDGYPNLWFTLVAASAERIEQILEAIRRRPGVESVQHFPAKRVFKLKVHVSTEADGAAGETVD